VLLVDASVILAAFDADDDLHEPARMILTDLQETLVTLDLARYEVTNVAVRAWRASASVAPLLEAIDRIASDGGVVLSTTALLARAARIAEEQTISVYGAAYVAAAGQTASRLISCDARDLIRRGLASSPADTHAGEPASADPE
jgi:predicted nucleic acid-binding protein